MDENAQSPSNRITVTLRRIKKNINNIYRGNHSNLSWFHAGPLSWLT